MEIVPAVAAPDFTYATEWFNSPPLSIKKLSGKVILLDCWTYTCIFCLRTIPIMRRLHEKYAEKGLQVIQAHSSEYEFASDKTNIVKAIQRFGIKDIPVVADKSNKIWESYGNMYWPKHVLIDHNGFVRFEHAGYGGMADFEEAVIELLEEAGGKQEFKSPDSVNPSDEIYDTYGMHFYGIAPETCVGYSRLRKFGNTQTMKPDEENFVADSKSKTDNQVYLRGKWIWQRESVQYVQSKEKDPAVIMKYNSAKRVHAIMGSTGSKDAFVEIRIDGKPVQKIMAGKDLKVNNAIKEGERIKEQEITTVNIDWPFMYNLIKTDRPEIHEIEVIPRSDNFKFYTFVFG